MTLPLFHLSDNALSLVEMTSSYSSPTDQYTSQLAIEDGSQQDGHCESSVGAATRVTLDDDDRFALALLDANYSLTHGYTSLPVNGTAWTDAAAAVVYFGNQAWFGDARYFPSDEEAATAFATFSEDYAASVLLGELDSRGLASPAAWSMRYVDAVDQIRQANAFSDEEWDEISEAAWNAEGNR